MRNANALKVFSKKLRRYLSKSVYSSLIMLQKRIEAMRRLKEIRAPPNKGTI